MRRLVLFSALVLAGCGDAGVGEMRQWMVRVQQQNKPVVAPLSLPTQFVPLAYTAQGGSDPFKLDPPASARASAAPRSKDGLERYPLEQIRLVGTIQMAGVTWALLQVAQMVYTARVGQRVGPSLGFITSVSESAFTLRENPLASGGAGREVEIGFKGLVSQESKK